MNAIFVATHGTAAKELIHSAEMICGKQENIAYTSFLVGESLADLRQKMLTAIDSLSLDGGGILFLTDLKGGSPFNVIVSLLNEIAPAEIITGVNIPMLLDACLSRAALSLTELANQVLESGRTGIYHYKKLFLQEEEDF